MSSIKKTEKSAVWKNGGKNSIDPDFVDGNVGITHKFGDLRNIIVLEADGIAHLYAFLTTFQIGKGQLDLILLIKVAVAAGDNDSAGLTVDKVHLTGQSGKIIPRLRKGGHGEGFDAAAGEQDQNQYRCQQNFHFLHRGSPQI